MMECIKGCGSLDQTYYERVEIDVCRTCSGVWLDFGELTSIVENKEKKWPQELISKVLAVTGKAGMPRSEDGRTLMCPKCKSGLTPVNYQNSSSIIVNTCENGHGLWLDSGELEKIQIYMEKWQSLAKENAPKYEAILDEIDKEQLIRDENQRAKGPSGSEKINIFLSKLAQIFD